MTMSIRALVATTALVLAAGCGADDSGSETSTGERTGVPTRSSTPSDDGPAEGTPDQGGNPDVEPAEGEPRVRLDGDDLVVVAFGSSSCPPKARSVQVRAADTWVVDVTPKKSTGQACTMDFVPTRSRIAAPTGASAAGDVSVVVLQDGARTQPMEIQPGR